MNRKYFFFDIDGTLLDSDKTGVGIVPESTKLALKTLKENGHFVAIATGRSSCLARKYMEMLNIENMVSDGGNGLTINNELIGVEPLDKQRVCDLIDECNEKGFLWGISTTLDKTRLVPNDDFYNQTEDEYIECIVTENLDPNNYDTIYKAYIACKSSEEVKPLETLKNLPWCHYGGDYIFVEPTDKSIGIKKMVDYFGGNYKDVVVFGDELNDLSMFKDEWFSIAMGNAKQELKDKANYVTSDIKNNGIYNALKHFNWI